MVNSIVGEKLLLICWRNWKTSACGWRSGCRTHSYFVWKQIRQVEAVGWSQKLHVRELESESKLCYSLHRELYRVVRYFYWNWALWMGHSHVCCVGLHCGRELITVRYFAWRLNMFRIWGFHSGGYEGFYLLGYNAVQCVESQLTFRRNISPSSSGSNNKSSKKREWSR
jgi:hypothetical protein